MPFDPVRIREHFPALAIEDHDKPRVYLDGPAGTQVPRTVIDRTVDYLVNHNANGGGAFRTARATDAISTEAHLFMADFLNAPSPLEIVFGPNMTTLTYQISRSLGKIFRPGERLMVTRMDHDANVYPWVQLAEDLGLEVLWLPFDTGTFRFDPEAFRQLLEQGVRLVAFCMASNALGTINPVKEMCRMAREAGALSYVDAVQYAPHGPIDVQDLGCDFLVCSAYKFFGGHQGILWGREELLSELYPYQVRPAAAKLPKRFETGTQSFEGQAGVIGALSYLAWLGETQAAEFQTQFDHLKSRPRILHAAMAGIQAYEKKLVEHLLTGLTGIPGIRVYGITASQDLHWRVPTVAITREGRKPAEMVRQLAAENIFAWAGHYYAVEVVKHLGLALEEGMVRLGIVHYNTAAEIDRCLEVIGS